MWVIEEYDPAWRASTVLLKTDNRVSTYRVEARVLPLRPATYSEVDGTPLTADALLAIARVLRAYSTPPV